MRKGPAFLAVLLTCAGTVLGGVEGSKHDFSSSGWTGGQICLPCHAVHPFTIVDINGNPVTRAAWNRISPPLSSYKMYIGGIALDGQEIDTTSILCMSCHDGSIAMDSFGGQTGSNFIGKGPGANPNANLGKDLTKDHPVGAAAVWPQTTPDTLVDPSLRDSRGIMPLGTLASNGRPAVGCKSCHDPHNMGNHEHMLWVSNLDSGTTVDGRSVPSSVLCFNCHKT